MPDSFCLYTQICEAKMKMSRFGRVSGDLNPDSDLLLFLNTWELKYPINLINLETIMNFEKIFSNSLAVCPFLHSIVVVSVIETNSNSFNLYLVWVPVFVQSVYTLLLLIIAGSRRDTRLNVKFVDVCSSPGS